MGPDYSSNPIFKNIYYAYCSFANHKEAFM